MQSDTHSKRQSLHVRPSPNWQLEIGNSKSNSATGESNSRPTPKAFGAALLLQVINRQSRILLSFKETFQSACLAKSSNFFLGDDLKIISEPFGGCRVAAQVLRKASIRICSGANSVDRTIRAEYKPTPYESRCQGGESNSRPRAYESPALPLSYPGVEKGLTAPLHPVNRPTPKPFGAALLRHSSPAGR